MSRAAIVLGICTLMACDGSRDMPDVVERPRPVKQPGGGQGTSPGVGGGAGGLPLGGGGFGSGGGPTIVPFANCGCALDSVNAANPSCGLCIDQSRSTAPACFDQYSNCLAVPDCLDALQGFENSCGSDLTPACVEQHLGARDVNVAALLFMYFDCVCGACQECEIGDLGAGGAGGAGGEAPLTCDISVTN